MGLFQSEEERVAEERDKTPNLTVGISQSKTEFEAPRENLRKALMEISALNDLLEASINVNRTMDINQSLYSLVANSSQGYCTC